MFSTHHLRHMWSLAGVLGLNLGDKARWLWSYYASRLPGHDTARPGTVDVTLRNRSTRPLCLTIQKNGYDWDTVDEIFVQNIYRFDLKPTGEVNKILDLGGNIGLAALFLSRAYPNAQICCVEPIPDNLSVLERNIRVNGANVQVVRAAVGAEDGTARFELSEDPRAHSSVGTKGVPNPKTIDVDVISVPSLLKLMSWHELDLLKIDIEGGEIAVLGNCPQWLEGVKNIIGEGHIGSGYTIETCRRDLEPMGFDVKLLRQNLGSFLFSAHRQN